MERDQASKFINDLLKLMINRNGSDLFITADFPPAIKVDGKVTKVSAQPLSATHTIALTRSIMSDKQVAEFERTKECNFAISPAGIGRFRVNAFVQQGKVGMVLRTIPLTLPTSMVGACPGAQRRGHDQARPVHRRRCHGLGQIDHARGDGRLAQRKLLRPYRYGGGPGRIRASAQELRSDAARGRVGYRLVGRGTQNTLRQAPDVILMGEIRDREGMQNAIMFSETGHLCLATLHANNANQAFDRIVNFFPEDRRAQLLMDLSLNMRAMISQRLIPKQDGKGRVAAVEVLLNTPLIADLIFRGEVVELKEIMKKAATWVCRLLTRRFSTLSKRT